MICLWSSLILTVVYWRNTFMIFMSTSETPFTRDRYAESDMVKLCCGYHLQILSMLRVTCLDFAAASDLKFSVENYSLLHASRLWQHLKPKPGAVKPRGSSLHDYVCFLHDCGKSAASCVDYGYTSSRLRLLFFMIAAPRLNCGFTSSWLRLWLRLLHMTID